VVGQNLWIVVLDYFIEAVFEKFIGICALLGNKARKELVKFFVQLICRVHGFLSAQKIKKTLF